MKRLISMSPKERRKKMGETRANGMSSMTWDDHLKLLAAAIAKDKKAHTNEVCHNAVIAIFAILFCNITHFAILHIRVREGRVCR